MPTPKPTPRPPRYFWRAIAVTTYGVTQPLSEELNRCEAAGWDIVQVLLRRPDEALIVMRAPIDPFAE